MDEDGESLTGLKIRYLPLFIASENLRKLNIFKPFAIASENLKKPNILIAN